MIGALKYFSPRYWAARFWPKGAASAAPIDSLCGVAELGDAWSGLAITSEAHSGVIESGEAFSAAVYLEECDCP